LGQERGRKWKGRERKARRGKKGKGNGSESERGGRRRGKRKGGEEGKGKRKRKKERGGKGRKMFSCDFFLLFMPLYAASCLVSVYAAV